jgi:hypothetical protein
MVQEKTSSNCKTIQDRKNSYTFIAMLHLTGGFIEQPMKNLATPLIRIPGVKIGVLRVLGNYSQRGWNIDETVNKHFLASNLVD